MVARGLPFWRIFWEIVWGHVLRLRHHEWKQWSHFAAKLPQQSRQNLSNVLWRLTLDYFRLVPANSLNYQESKLRAAIWEKIISQICSGLKVSSTLKSHNRILNWHLVLVQNWPHSNKIHCAICSALTWLLTNYHNVIGCILWRTELASLQSWKNKFQLKWMKGSCMFINWPAKFSNNDKLFKQLIANFRSNCARHRTRIYEFTDYEAKVFQEQPIAQCWQWRWSINSMRARIL